jgi:tRNA threonylcarbamoyladenosine biosynthesis protein TsaE
MQKQITSYTSNSPEETIQLAKNFSKSIDFGTVIFMTGDLGSGKTTFTKGFTSGIGFKSEVQSPTYPILNEYSNSINFIYHFDLYRLKSITEFLEIGGIEYLSSKNGICIIEWPELLSTFDIDNKIEVKFKLVDDKKRKIDIIK